MDLKICKILKNIGVGKSQDEKQNVTKEPNCVTGI
jgi:hypothetical protein